MLLLVGILSMSGAVKQFFRNVLFAFITLYQAHAGCLSKVIHQTLMIIGSHVIVGTPRECGMSGGIG